MEFRVSVRDGRSNRNRALVGADGLGEELVAYDTDVPVTDGALLLLPSGTAAPVLAHIELMSPPDGPRQIIAIVGD